MASGRIEGGAYSSGYDYFMTWSSVSKGSESNSSDVTLNWIMKKKVSGTYYNAYNTTSSTNITLNINGSTQTTNAPFDMRYDENGAERVLASYTVNVPHNSDGTKSIVVSGSHATGLGGSGWGTVSISDTTITLDTIPRYVSITSFSVSKRDETSVLFNWSADSECDWAWYSIDGGNTWANLDNSNVVWGLSANTSYAFKLRLRRRDSGLTTDSDVVWQKTYNYPYVVSANNFIIGNNINLNISNPLGRWYTLYFIGNDNNVICTSSSRNSNGDISVQNTAEEILSQYASIPNSNTGNYKVRLVVSSLSRDTTVNGAEYRTNTDNCKPTFNDFSFEDINVTTLALTGNNQNIIKRYSNVKAIITSINKATAQKYATMSKYSFVCGNSQTNINYSNSETVEGTINSVKSGVFDVYAVDSRTNSTVVTKIANEVIEYNDLIKNSISVSRQNGVSETTNLSIYGKIDLVDFGQVVNSIKGAKYRYKVTDSNVWSSYTNITLTVNNNGNFSFNGNIQGDTNDGFDIANSYNIEVVVNDELSAITFTANLSSGVPNIALHKRGVGIMGKYNASVGGLFQIDGKRIEMYETLYRSGGGITGDVTLSQNASEYTFLEIFYRDLYNTEYLFRTQAVGNITIPTNYYDTSSDSYYFGSATYTVSGNQLLYKYSARIKVNNDNTITHASNNGSTKISIHKVIGYKKI